MAFVIPEKRCLVLKVRDPIAMQKMIPESMVIAHDGVPLLFAPHTTTVIRLLQNIGMNIEGLEPYWWYYENKPLKDGISPPWKHQDKTAAFITVNPRCFVLHPPRMGKTNSAIWALGYLIEEKLVKGILIVAPNSCLHSVWASAWNSLFINKSVAILRGDKATRQKLLSMNYDVFVINPDGLKVIKNELVTATKSGRINAIILDESRDYANHTTDLWKATEEIVRPCEYVVQMTGTPGDPLDIYGQVKLTKPENVPKYKTAWRDLTMYQYGNPAFKQYKPRPNADIYVSKAMAPAIRYAKADVFDLPQLQLLTYEAELSKEQRKLYEEIKRDSIAQVQQGKITADTAAIRALKIRQICSGAVNADDTNPVYLDIAPRLKVLEEQCIAASESKVIIFVPYKAPMRLLEDALLKKKYTVARVDGTVTGHKRDRIFNAFQHSATPQILIAHVKTTAYGLELAIADTIVFWGPPQSGAFLYQQAIERINSSVQKSKSPAIVHLLSSPFERHGFAKIKEGADVNEMTVKQFEQLVMEEF